VTSDYADLIQLLFIFVKKVFSDYHFSRKSRKEKTQIWNEKQTFINDLKFQNKQILPIQHHFHLGQSERIII
jgi:hypothetical protein